MQGVDGSPLHSFGDLNEGGSGLNLELDRRPGDRIAFPWG